jgi:hypothetical protein
MEGGRVSIVWRWLMKPRRNPFYREEVVSNCKSCDAPVRFVKSAATGKWMILNASPVRGGNIIVTEGLAHVYPNWEAAIDAHPCMPLYQDHHATCPNAEQHRRKDGQE